MSSALEKKYEKYYQKLIDEIGDARRHFKIYKRLQEARSDYRKELNQAPGFFISTMQAHGDAGLMCVARVLKKRHDSITIWKFLDFVDQNPNLFPTGNSDVSCCVKEDKAKLDEFKEVIGAIIRWRDKKGAHIDEDFAFRQDDNLKEFTIKIEELFAVTETIVDILNRYSYAYNSSRTKGDYYDDDGVAIVLAALKDRIQRRREWREDLKKRAVS